MRIVRTRALNAAERRRVREPAAIEADDAPAEPVPLADHGLRERLVAALDGLSRVQREVVLLHDLEGWTHAEIAEPLGLTENNCRQHLFAARRHLRARLAHEERVLLGLVDAGERGLPALAERLRAQG